jgi:hypothetical protein
LDLSIDSSALSQDGFKTNIISTSNYSMSQLGFSICLKRTYFAQILISTNNGFTSRYRWFTQRGKINTFQCGEQ